MKIFLYITLALYLLSITSFATYVFSGAKKRSSLKRLYLSALSLLSLGLIVHLAAIAIRTYYSGRLPVAGIFETLSFFSFVLAILTFVICIRYKETVISLITLTASAAAFIFALTGLKPPRELPPILQTYWFEIHVIASFTAYALFTLAFAGGLLYLTGGGRGDEKRRAELHGLTLRAILWGFFFFSLSMFSGAIWGYLAWGAYWMWEPKILWSFIVWFWYAGAIHLIYLRGGMGGGRGEGKTKWREYSVPVSSLIGFVIMLFTWLGVGLLMKSSHSF